MAIITPNMNLIESTVNVDSGLSWEQNLNSSLTIIDGHNHSAGSGVQIQPTGLNINSSLSFQGNPAINLQGVVFNQQGSLSTLNSIFFKTDGNAYINDGNGNQIQVTSGGVINATSSGISNGTATASFVASVLVVNAASTTPANIQGGSLLLGNNSAGSKYLTLAPPSSMAANFNLTLPNPPSSTSFMQIDGSGNMSGVVGISKGLTNSNIANQTITQGLLALRATGSSVAAGGVATSSSCGSFTSSSVTPAAVTNLSVTIVTTGRPVFVGLLSDGIGSAGTAGLTNGLNSGQALSGNIYFYNASTAIAALGMSSSVNNLWSMTVPCTSFHQIDFPAAGTYTYSVKANVINTNVTVSVSNAVLVAYEL